MFCRYSAIQVEGYKAMEEDVAVEFDIVEDDKERSQAANVTILRHSTLKV